MAWYACPFGIPKYQAKQALMMKCDQCYDRTSRDLKPWCATVCPTKALDYGEYDEIVAQHPGRAINQWQFGDQVLETNVYVFAPPRNARSSKCCTCSTTARRPATRPTPGWPAGSKRSPAKAPPMSGRAGRAATGQAGASLEGVAGGPRQMSDAPLTRPAEGRRPALAAGLPDQPGRGTEQ